MPTSHSVAHRSSGEPSRPDPQKLLARLKAAEEQQQNHRGQFRIYLGAAPGVGKTFAMLNEGRRRQSRHTADVVIGFVETYDRPLTIQAAAGLEVIPRRRVEYQGAVLEEMDTDAILARHPTLVLVDELAHTNAPGSRHAQRWQDVEEILDAGINVITTVNIWHLESLKDQVKQITGRTVQETVPGWVIDQANDVELIDMTPEALRARLRHGNVYPPERAQRELEAGFQPATLAALRDLALVRTAKEVNSQLERYMRAHDLSSWRVDERVLVCIDHQPGATTLLRRGRLMAEGFRCSLLVMCLHMPSCSKAEQEQAERHRRFAQELGAEIVEIDDPDPVEAIAKLSAESRITQLIIGHAEQPRWLELFRGSLVKRLLRRLPDIDIHIVAQPKTQPAQQAETPRQSS